jgi:polyhydroxyalkanoate synthesis regulator phasin
MAMSPQASDGRGAGAGHAPQGRAAPSLAVPDADAFGSLAVRAGFVTEAQVRAVLAEQAERAATSARRGMKALPPAHVGDMLVAKGHMTPEQVRRVLRAQLLLRPSADRTSFGGIALARRYISRQELDEAVRRQIAAVLDGREAPSLRHVLLEMGALDVRSADAITAYQARADSVPMAELARERLSADSSGTDGRGGPSGHAAAKYLPKGRTAFICDNCVWLSLGVAFVVSLAMILLRDRLFG